MLSSKMVAGGETILTGSGRDDSFWSILVRVNNRETLLLVEFKTLTLVNQCVLSWEDHSLGFS